ncbi:MAG: LysR family transcriptional regulator [Microbacteriaceae bacterium]|jgi:DNA-binding transcriptional LysR family regulator|nr:LysR family transcriptional regulator [Microbacteriaceae bacterium]
MLDLRQLTALAAVADHHSVSRAAEALGWSQPTVTHHLTRLGREAGAPVVVARASGTALTAAGTAMLPHARAIIGRAHRARAEVREFVELQRTRVTIAMFPTLAARALPSLVRRLEEEGLNVSVVEAEMDVVMGRLENLGLDAAFVYSTAARPARCPAGFRRIPLFDESLMVFVPTNHRLADSGATSIADLADERWILGAHVDEPLESMIVTVARRAGFSLRAGARSDDYRVVAAYVAAGSGIAVMPAGEARLQRPGVTALELRDPDMTRAIELLVPSTLPADVVTHLVDALKASA